MTTTDAPEREDPATTEQGAVCWTNAQAVFRKLATLGKSDSRLQTLVIHGAVWYLAFLVAFFLIPAPVDPQIIILDTPPKWEGILAPNHLLTYGERINEGVMFGPESFVIDGDHIYTCGSDGFVHDIYLGTSRRLVRFGSGVCGGVHEEPTCGRPLGMRMDKDGSLLVIDAYFGLFRVDKLTGKYQTLYSSNTPVEGVLPKLLNDLDVDDLGRIYFTDSHDRFARWQHPWATIEMKPSGRLLMYDPQTGQTVKLAGGLNFPNGLQLTSDQTGVLVAETVLARILRYDIKTKTMSMWSDNLPAVVDNLRYSETTGTYFAGNPSTRLSATDKIDAVGKTWWPRKFLFPRIIAIDMLEVIEHNFAQAVGLVAAAVTEFDHQGQIVAMYHDLDGQVAPAPSEVQVIGDVMYVGTVRADFMLRLNMTLIAEIRRAGP